MGRSTAWWGWLGAGALAAVVGGVLAWSWVDAPAATPRPADRLADAPRVSAVIAAYPPPPPPFTMARPAPTPPPRPAQPPPTPAPTPTSTPTPTPAPAPQPSGPPPLSHGGSD